MPDKPKTSYRGPALALAALALASCASPLATGPATAALVGPEWVLHEAEGQRPLQRTGLTLNFAADGQVFGEGGCNRFTGRWAARGARLDLSGLAATAMSCSEPGVMEREQAYLKSLQAIRSFDLQGQNRLVLDGPEGDLVFISVPTPAS